MKVFKSDGFIMLVIVSVLISIGIGVGRVTDLSLPSSMAWPFVVLIIVGVVSWFVYNINTDGFAVKSAKNKEIVNKMWDSFHERKQLAASKKESAK